MTEEQFMQRARNITRESRTRLDCGYRRIQMVRANDNVKQKDWYAIGEALLWFGIVTLALILITYNLFLR